MTEEKAISVRGLETVNRILDASAEFIQQEGLSALKTNHIPLIVEAGISPYWQASIN